MKLLRILVIPLLALWLAVWLVLSWPAIQDDALIHLRYADFLYSKHYITFDGLHPSFGASSLLYVGLLAVLRPFTASPLLSRSVSTAAHILLFVSFAIVYWRSRTASLRVQLFLVSILLLLVAPSSVRWLDDGMETGIVLCLIAVLAWHTHRLSLRVNISTGDFLSACALGCILVFLRIELATAAIFASLILIASASKQERLRTFLVRLPFVSGAFVAAVAIRLLMHSFLPDTALAKSHGILAVGGSLHAAATVLVGALLFGLGSLCLWLVSATIVLRHRHARYLPTLIANLIFPFVLAAAALRGQEIQGARYLVWCFFFSICWNLLELRRIDAEQSATSTAFPKALAIFLLCCLAVLPLESHLVARVLSTRAHTMRAFMEVNLAPSLHDQVGVAGDVGYISYFSQDNICDLSGLVNGRATARMSSEQRLSNCAAQHPTFALLNSSQTGALTKDLDISQWKVCGEYDFGNLREPDRHYLLIDPQLEVAVCRQTNYVAEPASIALTESAY